MYQPQIYQFRFTVIIAGAEQEQYTRRMTQAEAWRESAEISAEKAELYADYRVGVECLS